MGTHIPLGITDFSRSVAETPHVALLNRYFEQDPTNLKTQASLIARPGLRKWKTLPTAPVRALYSQPGSFDNALFAVSGNTLYRIDADESVTTIGTLTTSTGYVSMAATDTYLFVADGTGLEYYTDNDYARGTLTASAISDTETVTIGSVVYKFTSGDVDTGTPQGTAGAPWLVKLGGTVAISLANLAAAIGGTGQYGTDYSSLLTVHPDVVVSSNDATTVKIRSVANGTGGNAIATTETGAGMAWGAATLAGGGGSAFTSVAVPDGDGIISVAMLLSYVICVVAQGFGKNGRFYWINPGEVTIEDLNFATAERAPDPTWNAIDDGDSVWFPGLSSNEIWYLQPDGTAVFQRQQGRLFDKGTWEGSVLKLKDSMLAVGTDGTVYEIVGGEPVVISTPGVAQRFREAINATRAA